MVLRSGAHLPTNADIQTCQSRSPTRRSTTPVVNYDSDDEIFHDADLYSRQNTDDDLDGVGDLAYDIFSQFLSGIRCHIHTLKCCSSFK